jgi:cytokinesis protein
MSDNEAAAEEQLSLAKRKQAAEESRANRQKLLDSSPIEDDDVLDNLLEKLRNGDTVGRRARRARPSVESHPAVPSTLNATGSAPAVDTVDIARDMLARLKSDGFEAFTPTSPTAQKRRRRRPQTSGDLESPTSPLSSEITKDISSDGMSMEETAEVL